MEYVSGLVAWRRGPLYYRQLANMHGITMKGVSHCIPAKLYLNKRTALLWVLRGAEGLMGVGCPRAPMVLIPKLERLYAQGPSGPCSIQYVQCCHLKQPPSN